MDKQLGRKRLIGDKMGKENTARELYDEIGRDFKTSNRTRRTDLEEFMTLRLYGKENKVEFSVGWYKTLMISFRPKTIGVELIVNDKKTGEKERVSKSYPLDQPDLLDTILNLLS